MTYSYDGTLSGRPVTAFTTAGAENPEELFLRLSPLVGAHIPRYVWADNRGDRRRWVCYSLPVENGRAVTDLRLDCGGYRLFLPMGTRVEERAGGVTALTGGCFFQRNAPAIPLGEVAFRADGHFSFRLRIHTTDELAIGLEYYTLRHDGRLGRDLPVMARSPLFLPDAPLCLDCVYFPAAADETIFELKEALTVESCLASLYGEGLRLDLHAGFRFVLQPRAALSLPSSCYLAPSGTASAAQSTTLTPGLSGAEYLRVPKGARLRFLPGRPAYFGGEALPVPPCTSYLSVSGGMYYSQPAGSLYYTPGGELFAPAELPGIPADGVALPVMPFFKADCEPELAEALETNHIAPLRREQISASLGARNEDFSAAKREAVTRHGLRVSVSGEQIEWLRIGVSDEAAPQLALTRLSPRLMVNLGSHSLFAVLCDPALLAGHADTPYSLTERHVRLAETGGYGDAEKLAPLLGNVYLSRDAFDAAVSSVGAVPNAALRDACDHWGVTAAGWRFLLNPALWEENGTLAVLKYTEEASVAELMDAPELWCFAPGEEKIARARETFRGVKETLQQTGNAELMEIVNDPLWCGTVIFRCGVDLKSLPGELGFLANGIKAEEFRACFLAFPADGGEDAGRVSALIDYRGDAPFYSPDYLDYAFKVRRLRVCVQNAAVYDFSARAELLINRLFQSRATAHSQESGNGAVFDGSYQRDTSGGGHYIFGLQSPETYGVSGGLVSLVTIEKASLLTDGDSCVFHFMGSLAFARPNDTDLLSYDSIGYTGLQIAMKPEGGVPRFTFDARGLAFETGGAVLRENSFAALFPVTPLRVVTGAGGTPEGSGYSKFWVRDHEAEDLGADWYGVVWRITPGNMGDLAGAVTSGFELLTAWEPGDGAFKSYIGIRSLLTGGGGGWEMPLMGMMQLGFEAIELHRDAAKEGETEKVRYYFRFRNFGLTLLGKRFPETNNDLYLISDESRGLGWYGAAGG